MLKQFRKLTVLLLAAALLFGCIAQISPVYAAETEVQTEADAEIKAETLIETEAAAEAETAAETEAEKAEPEADSEEDYSICGDFTSGEPADFEKNPETGLYTYTANLKNTTLGWNEYEFYLTLNGEDYGARDWVIYDCTEKLALSKLQDSGVFKLWLCNTRNGIYTFILDPEESTLTVNGSSDDYGAFLVFTELVEDGENPYYYMDDKGETETFGTAEKTMKANVPSWEPDGYWDVQIASGGKFYGNNAAAIEGATNEVWALEENQTFTFASDAPHLWYDFCFGTESHKMVVQDGGDIMVNVNFLVSDMDGEPLDAKIIVNGQEVSEQERYVEATTLNVKAPKIDGYHFVGWYGSPDEDEWWEKDDELLWVEPEFEYTVREFSFETTKTQTLEAVYDVGDEVSVTGINLTEDDITLGIGLSENLHLEVLPEGATVPEITWTSSNPNIVSVDENGIVTAKKEIGSAVVTASASDGAFSDSCTVSVRFRDVMDPGKYFYTPIYWAAANEITKGYLQESDPHYGEFGENVDCTRGAVMVFLWRLAGKPSVSGITNPFNDVSKKELGTAYYNAILWAYNKGITKGYSDGGFHPNDTLTRKDIMIMLYRFAEKPSFTDKKGMKFTDVVGVYNKNSDTYKAICWGYNLGITNGYSIGDYAGQFGCKLPCLRRDIVTFIWRYKGKPPV